MSPTTRVITQWLKQPIFLITQSVVAVHRLKISYLTEIENIIFCEDSMKAVSKMANSFEGPHT